MNFGQVMAFLALIFIIIPAGLLLYAVPGPAMDFFVTAALTFGGAFVAVLILTVIFKILVFIAKVIAWVFGAEWD